MGIKKLLIICGLVWSSAAVYGQNVVEHTIVEGNTIYGIAKEYNSTVEGIFEANPNIGVRNLVIGESIFVPVPEKEVIDSSLYTFHRVRSFESVYSVANKYKMKDSTIFWHNPVLKGSAVLQKDQFIKIPKDPDGWKQKSGEFDSLVPEEKPKYQVYVVKKGDTPEQLQKAWGIYTLDEFFQLNPDARKVWYKGMTLVKPVNKAAAQYHYAIEDLEEPISVAKGNEPSDTIDVACILPFFLDQYINEGPGKRRSELAFSIRQGIELAVAKTHEETAAHIHMRFYDSFNQQDTVSGIIDALSLSSPDLILGPLYSSRIMQLNSSALSHNTVNLISKQPVINQTSFWNNVVAESVLYEAIKDDYKTKLALNAVDSSTAVSRKLLIVGMNVGPSAVISRQLTEGFSDQEYVLIEGDNSWVHNEQLVALDTSISYDLVITSNDPAYVLDVLRNLRSTELKYHWYTQEYQALNNGLVSDIFSREQVTLVTSNFTDHQEEAVQRFTYDFRERFGRQPDQFAFEAFDNARFHLLRLTQGTSKWRGVTKGFFFTEENGKRNAYTEFRQFKNLRWEERP